MQLIGYLDSPFVRRVAISMRMLEIEFQHRELSIFRDFEEFRAINPLVKVPTLLLDDGQLLVDSNLIIEYLEKFHSTNSLMPNNDEAYAAASQHIGVALIVMEKVAGLIYETSQRGQDKQDPGWTDRLRTQLGGAVSMMEAAVTDCAVDGWMFGEEMTQADISIAVAWRFTQHIEVADINASDYPALRQYSARCEALAEFIACPLG